MRLIIGVLNLPPELAQPIIKYVVEVRGDVYWKKLVFAIEICSSVPYDCDESTLLSAICSRIGEQDCFSTFSDELVDILDIGFCYLKPIPTHRRAAAFKNLYAFPTLFQLLNFADSYGSPGCIDNFSVVVKCIYTKEGCYPYGHIVNFMHESDIKFLASCEGCRRSEVLDFYCHREWFDHQHPCEMKPHEYVCSPLDDEHYCIPMGGFLDVFKSSGGRQSSQSTRTKTPISQSKNHEDKQILRFTQTVKGNGGDPDMHRDLYSVPRPEEVENMADHLQNHKPGDNFPYLAVVGNEEESKDSRLARLRAYKTPYGKENKPEKRINGIILNELEGILKVEQLKDYVTTEGLSKTRQKENKKFTPIASSSFKKPYVQITRITGEYVPLMSSTANYTDLHFTLEDGRLLEHQTIAQSANIPSNQNGVFELSCDYCINTSDLDQLSLKYFLARPIMREGRQWGAVSLSIRLSESDTPYITPKVDAMAIVRTPYTTLEERQKDPDHADVLFTSGHIRTFQEMYRAGEIVDVDEPKKERTKRSSYSKSTIRGAQKGEAGPSHLSSQEGWEHLQGMIKPRLAEGIASISADSGNEEDDITVEPLKREQYEAQQELMRLEQEMIRKKSVGSDTTEDIPDHEVQRIDSVMGSDDSQQMALKSSLKKTRFAPDTEHVFEFN
jgi:hypothetical protein